MGAQRASDPSMNQTRVRGCLCVGVSVCRFGFSTLPASKRSKFNTVTALGNAMSYIIIHENCRGKGTGMVGVQTVVSMRCAANQRNVVRQSNCALKAINGAGNAIIA